MGALEEVLWAGPGPSPTASTEASHQVTPLGRAEAAARRTPPLSPSWFPPPPPGIDSPISKPTPHMHAREEWTDAK